MTQPTVNEPIEFSFRFVNQESGETAHGGSGLFDGERISLGGFAIAASDLIEFTNQEDTFYFLIERTVSGSEAGQPQRLAVEIYDTDRERLRSAINAARSSSAAQKEQERLIDQGQGDLYHDAKCPFCQATIVLTGLPETPQVYCVQCDTLFSRDRSGIGDIERHFRRCSNCEMYSRPRSFSVFYFYFLVITFGFHYDSAIRCSACMRSAAWKMVLGNLFGLFGFPFALIQLYRSYSTRSLSGVFEGLDDANALARSGKVELALDKYDEIMDRVPDNAGVKYNIATGLLVQRDFAHAEQMFELSLEDCANYSPSVVGLVMSLHEQGKTDEIEAVSQQWNQRHAESTPVSHLEIER